MKFLRLHVRQKAFSLSLFASCHRFWTDLQKNFFSYFINCLHGGVARIKLLSLDTQAKVFIKATLIVKFRMCEYDMPCALEKTAMAYLSTLIMWSSKITRQTKTIISPLTQCLNPKNLVGWWFKLGGFCPQSDMTLWSYCLPRSQDKLKPLYHHYESVYHLETWQVNYLPWEAPIHVATRPYIYVVLLHHPAD